MVSVPQVARALQSTLIDLPAEYEVTSGYRRRRSKFTGAAFVQTTVLGWLAHPAGSLHELTTVAADVGVTISPQGLDQRFGLEGATLLKSVLESAVEQVITARPGTLPVLNRFPAVVVLDSTTITLPDELESIWVSCGGSPGTAARSAIKATVRMDLCQGRLDGPVLTDARRQDKSSVLQHAEVPAGALRIGDLGFWSLTTLQELRAHQAHFLSRLHVQTVVARADDGSRLDLVAWLGAQQDDQAELAVSLGVTHRVPARLLAIRVSPLVAEQRRRAIRAIARRKGQTPNRANLARADWTLLVTSVPLADLSLVEAEVLIRARWQIELLFKLWKSDGQIDAWRTHKPSRILCELYAKLIAMIIQHWLLLTGGWSRPDHSMVRSATTIRGHATCLAVTLHHPVALRRTLAVIADLLAHGTGITKRRSKPCLAQLLANPSFQA
jgi:Transposase DDE domain